MWLAEKSGESFKERIAQASLRNASRIIAAVDINDGAARQGFERAQILLEETAPHLCAVKFQRQTILNLGSGRTRRLVRLAHERGLPCIIDDKMNDIGETNIAVARAYFRLGFDALTVNPFIGWKGGLQPVFQAAHESNKGVLPLVYMSHPGASEGFGQMVYDPSSKKPVSQYRLFARKAMRWEADGAVVGATKPLIVKEVKQILGRSVPIYSPGIGAQGGTLKRALQAGTDYFIIGRSIIEATNPGRAVARFARMSRVKKN